MKLMALLQRLELWLIKNRASYHRCLLPAAKPADLDELETTLTIRLPEELRELLGWHNGQSADVPARFEQDWNLMSTAAIAGAKRDLDEQANEGWNKAWIPFLDDDAGNYVCLDTSQPDCPVREYWQGKKEHPIVAASLAAWLEDFIGALERGEYSEDPERGSLLRHRG